MQECLPFASILKLKLDVCDIISLHDEHVQEQLIRNQHGQNKTLLMVDMV